MPPRDVPLHCTGCQQEVVTVPGPLPPVCPHCGRVNWMSPPNPREDVLTFGINDRRFLKSLRIQSCE